MKPIKIGTVVNHYDSGCREVPRPLWCAVTVRFPSRLNAMAIDPSKIDIAADGRYSAGEVVFAINLCKEVTVSVTGNDGETEVDAQSKRPLLIEHAVRLMQSALGVKDGLHITVSNQQELRHVGLGSSSGLIVGVAAAINELYGNPMDRADLLRYLAQNHAEEIDGARDEVMPVQCLGGSGAAILFEGGALIVAGENVVIAASPVADDYTVLIGLPIDYVERDAQVLMEAELKTLPKFIHTGVTYGPQIAYNILHRMLPGMVRGDLTAVGEVIYDYRFNMGSIDNCSFVYDGLNRIAQDLKIIHEQGLADVLALSSVGPGFFVITKQTQACAEIMEKAGLRLIKTNIHNAPYQIVGRR